MSAWAKPHIMVLFYKTEKSFWFLRTNRNRELAMKTLLSLLVICLLLGGCGVNYTVSIDSINSGPFTPDRTCYIDSGMQGVPTNDLRFEEFSDAFMGALRSVLDRHGRSLERAASAREG